ncbi:hypothetical protein RHMOL_Rhmol06G0298800 [Rhododendron molle]|uniref:Uncharacterized protein n=1 Tax=Rhododendron molle TaxID=49168 RepID=A0ACC0NK18_RHOML|nr:hypothetical protein RHMOL_Rhmol06G0298800 [Rhododendron molle]
MATRPPPPPPPPPPATSASITTTDDLRHHQPLPSTDGDQQQQFPPPPPTRPRTSNVMFSLPSPSSLISLESIRSAMPPPDDEIDFGSVDLISKHVLNVAIHLARGTRIALAPVVLSWLYRDLRLLKNAIFSKKVQNVGLNLWAEAPMKLVQIWAWERVPTLRPRPNPLNPDEPRLAKWNNVKKKNIANVGLALSSVRECFQWRLYTISENNWVFPKFYKERKEWVSFCLEMDEDFESFAQFLRPCELVNLRIFELVGFDSLERYLPHRVAMQFRMDQDLPGLVPRFNDIPKVA